LRGRKCNSVWTELGGSTAPEDPHERAIAAKWWPGESAIIGGQRSAALAVEKFNSVWTELGVTGGE